MNEPQRDILEQIHDSYYQFTAAERKVADYILSKQSQVQFMSITQLAEECGTAEATISRFCRTLQLKGFNAFKIELARHVSVAPAAEAEKHDAGTTQGRCQEVGRMAIDAIRQTMELIQPQQVEEAVTLIENASRVVCIGSGGSMLLATTLAQLFSTVTAKFQAVADSHIQMSAVATMSKEDIIILFSYSGATNVGLQILELARARGIKTILVTRFSKSPAASLANVVLLCGSNEGPFQLGSVPAKVAQMMVMDALFQEYLYRNRASCEENIENIAAALSDMHV